MLNLVVEDKDIVIFSSIISITILVIPYRLTLAATESAYYLVLIAGKIEFNYIRALI